MAGTGSSRHSVNNNPQSEKWMIKKPASNSSREIRDNILRENFGYTETDIIELDRKLPGYFYISDSRDTQNPASVEHILSWGTNSIGQVPITLSKQLIDNLIKFREERMTAQIIYAVSFIFDPGLEAKVSEDLTKLLSQSGDERFSAASNLLLATTGNLRSATEVGRTLAYLTEKAGYPDNPFLILARANASMTEYKMKAGPGYNGIVQVLLGETIRKTNNNLIFNSTNAASAITTTEAAFINRELSRLYHQLGNDSQFRRREWMARFYNASAEELADLNEGDIIELAEPGPSFDAPGLTTDAQSKLKTLNQNYQQKREFWDANDKIGSRVVPTDHRTSELYQKSTDGFETEVIRGKTKIRAGQSGYKGQFKVVTYSERPYQRANVIADGVGAAFELPLKFAKHGITLQRLHEITTYLNKKTELEKEIKNQGQRVVPLKPETIEILVKQLQHFGRINVNPSGKIKIKITLEQLEDMWEESNAFWKNKKYSIVQCLKVCFCLSSFLWLRNYRFVSVKRS